MADVSDSPRTLDRCPNCGQPFVMGMCGLCGTRQTDLEGGAPPIEGEPPAPPAEGALPPPPVAASPASPPPVKTRPASGAPSPPGQRTQTLIGLGVALLIITLLAAVFSIAKVSSLDSKLKDERTARENAENRVQILEGSIKGVQDNQVQVQSQLDAQAAADPTAVASRVQPSVYTIATSRELGSAWVVSSDGVTAKFVTNYHVIADAWESGDKNVEVFQDQGAQLTGTIEQALPDIDLALVDVQANIPALKQSNETPRPGETIIVVGSPLGLGGSVTTGAVSAVRDDSGVKFIQFSAPISPGNSGGPLVNSLGEVIGITEAKAIGGGAEGIGIAIPVNQVCTRLQIC